MFNISSDLPFLFPSAFLGIVLVFYARRKLTKHSAPLPPGPKGLPLLGNLLDLPQTQPWITYTDWGKKYGGIVYASAMGSNIIVLNDAQYAKDMLEKKGRLYSDRPTLVMGGQLVGWDKGPALISFGERWSEYRRLFSQFMGTRSKIEPYQDVLHQVSLEYVKNIVDDPFTWVAHTKRFAASIVLMLAYGYKAVDKRDRMVQVVDDAMEQFSETTGSNAFLVDLIPFMRYIPEWFPGAAWKKKASKYKATLQEMLDLPYEWTMRQLASGDAKACFLASQLEDRKPQNAEEEEIIKWAAAGIYSGGADTTVAGIESFVLAMTLHGEAQRQAQREIDSVIGTERLPTLSDRERLPYFEALYSEVFRTYSFGKLGLPHVSREDDVHDGYFIPKGSIVITNNWLFNKDPQVYSNPEIFSPERFISTSTKPKEKDPKEYLFGYGRRICPGLHLADASMWLACVNLIAAFDIQPGMQDGKPVIPDARYLDGSINHPAPFQCEIKPRSIPAESLVRSAQH